MKEPELKSLNCPFKGCDGVMLFDKDKFWRCPDCGSEVWFQPLGKPKEERKLHFIGTGTEICRSMVGSTAPGGSGSSGKSNRKQLLKKPTTTNLYKNLCVPGANDNAHLRNKQGPEWLLRLVIQRLRGQQKRVTVYICHKAFTVAEFP